MVVISPSGLIVALVRSEVAMGCGCLWDDEMGEWERRWKYIRDLGGLQ
jgi:hypothetical protein